MRNGVDAVGIDQQVQHYLSLLLESTVGKHVCYNLESKQRENVSCTLKLCILFESISLREYLLIFNNYSPKWR